MKLKANIDQLMQELYTLAGFTQCEQTGKSDERAVTRVVFSEDDLRARAWLRGLYEEAGLEVREDAVGNVFARWVGSDPTLGVVGTGSHTDAIPHAGMFDGTVGVLGGLEAIRTLQRAGVKPKHSIELLMFTSEEPTRFGIGCVGSRLLGGTVDPDRIDRLKDEEEQPMSAVRTAAGFNGPLVSVKLPEDYYSAWVELHIEQGPLLERDGVQIGVVESIAAPASYRITIDGVGGHAGALLMPDRKDALCAAAEIILEVEKATLATGKIDTVGTVGTVKVHPGAINSVPSKVTVEIDVRDTDPDRRESVMTAVWAVCKEMKKRRGVSIFEEQINADLPAVSATKILDAVEASCEEIGVSYRRMVSRAYHDSLFMARIAPIAMIFIPCRNGVSHRPDEYVKPEDLRNGVEVLAATLGRLAAE